MRCCQFVGQSIKSLRINENSIIGFPVATIEECSGHYYSELILIKLIDDKGNEYDNNFGF